MSSSWENVQKLKRKTGFKAGDTVRVYLRVSEGDSERTQAFEGTVLGIRGIGAGQTFTVRKTSFGVGVERTFPVQSPRIEKIVKVKTNKARRAKLYFLRDRAGKAARLTEIEEKKTAAAPAKPATDGAKAPAKDAKDAAEPKAENAAAEV